MGMPENMQEQLDRLALASVEMTEQQKGNYITGHDDLGEIVKGTDVPVGYKRCGRCGHGKKFFLFNKNNGSKTNTSGNCKECQKGTAKQSYGKTKQRRNYRKYYQENKEVKQKHARKYYEENKAVIKEKHKAYLGTKRGQKVMRKAHTKRREALAANKGIAYTRELVIIRDSAFIGQPYPVCYLCEQPITDTSGKGLHLDHVIPVVEGGLDCFTNVASSHAECNLRREKDARELTAEQVEQIVTRADAFIDVNPERFE